MINTITNYDAKMNIIWDLGRRCTYKCSYCDNYRSNDWSPIATWEELTKSLHFIEEYCELYDFYRSPYKKKKDSYSWRGEVEKTITFTGGEPTVNPRLFDLIDYGYEHLDPSFNFGLTTNAAFSKARAEKIKNSRMIGTISYHAEADRKTKDLVVENILILKDKFKVNVMFHKDYFQECVDLCEFLDKEKISYVPRIIGDGGDIELGVERGTIQVYSDEQMEWFRNYWGSSNKGTTNNCSSLGRACCGKRKFDVYDPENEQWENTTFLSDTNFFQWNCMVNWYFLYLHQELDLVYHHQTCAVTLDNKVGPIGKISEGDKIIADLENKFLNNEMPTIRCPKDHCGCGMCISKTSDDIIAKDIWKNTTRGVEFKAAERRDNPIPFTEHDDIPRKTTEYDLEKYNIHTMK